MIRDQRTMYHGYRIETVADVRQVWEHLAGRVTTETGDPITMHEAGETLSAYVNQNRWVADCPECCSGIPGWPEHDKGACHGCGGIYSLSFPSAERIDRADAVLSTWRNPLDRGWYPDRETLADLQCQGLLMGDVPADFAGIVDDGKRLANDDLMADYSRILNARHLAAIERPQPRALERGGSN